MPATHTALFTLSMFLGVSAEPSKPCGATGTCDARRPRQGPDLRLPIEGEAFDGLSLIQKKAPRLTAASSPTAGPGNVVASFAPASLAVATGAIKVLGAEASTANASLQADELQKLVAKAEHLAKQEIVTAVSAATKDSIETANQEIVSAVGAANKEDLTETAEQKIVSAVSAANKDSTETAEKETVSAVSAANKDMTETAEQELVPALIDANKGLNETAMSATSELGEVSAKIGGAMAAAAASDYVDSLPGQVSKPMLGADVHYETAEAVDSLPGVISGPVNGSEAADAVAVQPGAHVPAAPAPHSVADSVMDAVADAVTPDAPSPSPLEQAKAVVDEAIVSPAEAADCTPQCSWMCDSPVCDEVCRPVCAPPKCETRCGSPDISKCSLDCTKAECMVTCPKTLCPKKECSKCSTSCSSPSCKLRCPDDQPCRNVCDEPVCEWDCHAPVLCPKPQCSMVCEHPKNCFGSTHDKIPDLLPGEVSVGDFDAKGGSAVVSFLDVGGRKHKKLWNLETKRL